MATCMPNFALICTQPQRICRYSYLVPFATVRYLLRLASSFYLRMYILLKYANYFNIWLISRTVQFFANTSTSGINHMQLRKATPYMICHCQYKGGTGYLAEEVYNKSILNWLCTAVE